MFRNLFLILFGIIFLTGNVKIVAEDSIFVRDPKTNAQLTSFEVKELDASDIVDREIYEFVYFNDNGIFLGLVNAEEPIQEQFYEVYDVENEKLLYEVPMPPNIDETSASLLYFQALIGNGNHIVVKVIDQDSKNYFFYVWNPNKKKWKKKFEMSSTEGEKISIRKINGAGDFFLSTSDDMLREGAKYYLWNEINQELQPVQQELEIDSTNPFHYKGFEKFFYLTDRKSKDIWESFFGDGGARKFENPLQISKFPLWPRSYENRIAVTNASGDVFLYQIYPEPTTPVGVEPPMNRGFFLYSGENVLSIHNEIGRNSTSEAFQELFDRVAKVIYLNDHTIFMETSGWPEDSQQYLMRPIAPEK